MDFPPLLIDTAGIGDGTSDLPPTPVTIVTGFLGSGKSTLLKHLTETNKGKKIAVVLNEFGQTSDIERSLNVLKSDSDGGAVEQWVELDNGCMCCTAKDAGVAALEKLMDRSGRFDYIFIETSGLADPAPIASMFWLDAALQAKVQLDGVVCVVDVNNIVRSLDESPLASVQVACADLILVNKCDQSNPETIEKVLNRLRGINGTAKIIQSEYSKVDPSKLLDLVAYSSQFAPPEHTYAVSHGLSTIVIPLSVLTTQEYEKVESCIQHLLWNKELKGSKFEIHRAKGRLQKEVSTHILQGVRETYEITDVPYEPEAEGKLVFIGSNLDEEEIKKYISG